MFYNSAIAEYLEKPMIEGVWRWIWQKQSKMNIRWRNVMCQNKHDFDACFKRKRLECDEKKRFLIKSKLCFGCYVTRKEHSGRLNKKKKMQHIQRATSYWFTQLTSKEKATWKRRWQLYSSNTTSIVGPIAKSLIIFLQWTNKNIQVTRFLQCWRESTKRNLLNNKWSSAALLTKHWEKYHAMVTVFEANGPRSNQGKLSLCSTAIWGYLDHF